VPEDFLELDGIASFDVYYKFITTATPFCGHCLLNRASSADTLAENLEWGRELAPSDYLYELYKKEQPRRLARSVAGEEMFNRDRTAVAVLEMIRQETGI
jgi:hypothetical protein